VTNFNHLKQLFVDAYTLSKMRVQALPHGPGQLVALKLTGGIPLLPVTLSQIESLATKGVELTTKGEFSESLKVFREALRSVSLVAVVSSKELKMLQGLIGKVVEYITAMRIEIERKKLVAANTDPVRVCELACLMTLCNMENAHKFLAYKNAFTLLYKMGNFITAAHFARQVVSLEPFGVFESKPEIVPQYKKYF
jgi:coatomer protein complex subunit alpha (xenin)